MAAQNRIVELSSLIAQQTALIDSFFVQNKLPTPSLDPDALPLLPIPDDATDITTARAAVIRACSELKALLTGPRKLVEFEWTAYVSVKAILRFKLDQSFPVGESTSFEAMSEFSGLDVKNVRRIVRHAIINHRFFHEKALGEITHSALTAVLVNDPVARNRLVVGLEEFWPAGVKMADAMERWPNSGENNETGFTLAHNSIKGMYATFADNPDRGERFGRFATGFGLETEELLENYPWAEKATMVDVGGSHGGVSIRIAEKFPNMTCVVQDLPDTAAEGSSRLPADLKDRVSFMAHDFFTPQTVTSDVYYFRYIFHNWSDKYCIKILQNLIPALKPGARIIIHERVLPGFEHLKSEEGRKAINFDVGMQQLLNACERELSEWSELLRCADSRFRWIGAKHCPGTNLWIMEAEWQG